MRLRKPVSGARHEDILELEPLLRRVVGARVRDLDTVDDLVQEALARVIAVRGRLDDEAVAPYAIVTARNLVTSLAREEERSRRHRSRLVDPSEPERPEDAALRQEEAAAVETALAGLPDHEWEAVVAHEIEGVDTATLAEARQSTPGAVGVQLARTRARLRLDYLLALRRVELPTARCRPVLLALSAGDRRRQLALDAGGHLMQCPTCASLSRPLVERRRSIAVLLPVPSREVLARHAGQPVRGVNVPARGVDADEGFWVGTDGGNQLWVQLIGRGESPFQVRTGQGPPSPAGWSPTRRDSPSGSGWCRRRARPWPGARATTSKSPTPTSPWSRDRRVAPGRLDLGRPAGVDLGHVGGRGSRLQGDDLAEGLVLVLEEELAGGGPRLPLVVGLHLDVPGHPIPHRCLRSHRERRPEPAPARLADVPRGTLR
jgi:RNA polymerase sigma factor (sigma-70 family)